MVFPSPWTIAKPTIAQGVPQPTGPHPILLGDVGLSLETISKGKPGQAAFHGKLFEVIAQEDIPRYDLVVVVDLPNRVRIYEPPVRGLARATGTDLHLLSSDANGHFQASLGQDAKTDENLSGLVANKVLILAVTLQAKQQLHYRLWLFSKDIFDDPDLDKDSYLDHVELDLSGNGVQIGAANQFYLASRLDPPLRYVDEDESRELHVSLQNVSPTSKTAGKDGQVRVLFQYSPIVEEV